MTFEERVERLRLLIVKAKFKHPGYWRLPIMESRYAYRHRVVLSYGTDVGASVPKETDGWWEIVESEIKAGVLL